MEIKHKSELINAFEKKIGARPCPLCGKLAGFTFESEEFQHLGFERNRMGVDFTKEHNFIPCATIVCKNCGCIQQIALPVLLNNPNYISDSL